MSDDFEPKISDPNVDEKSGTVYSATAAHVPKQSWWRLGGKDISFAAVDPASSTSSNSGSIRDDLETSVS